MYKEIGLSGLSFLESPGCVSLLIKSRNESYASCSVSAGNKFVFYISGLEK